MPGLSRGAARVRYYPLRTDHELRLDSRIDSRDRCARSSLARPFGGGLHFLNQSVNLSSDLPRDSGVLKYLGINCGRKDVNLVFGQCSEYLG